MKQVRQDSWKKSEDEFLVKTVLHYIAEGKTQLDAFKEAAKVLHRTTAACGFRWNATLRKFYIEDIHLARNKRKNVVTQGKDEGAQLESINDIQRAITLLKKFQTKYQADHTFMLKQLRQENEELKEKLYMYEKWFAEIDGVVKEGRNIP